MPTLEQQLADAIKAQNDLTQVVSGYKSQLDSTVAAQKAEYDKWRAGVFLTGNVKTSLNAYKTIAKFQAQGLVSMARLTISGTTGSFVFAKILDVCVNHPGPINVISGANSTYGSLKIRICSDSYGGGTIEAMRLSGNEGDAFMSMTITPYSGNFFFYEGIPITSTDAAKVFEATYS